MQVFRLCKYEEFKSILEKRNFKYIGQEFQINSQKNTHQYLQNVKYMHFFKDEISLLYLEGHKGDYVFVYDIPDEILNVSSGYGFYFDFINFSSINKITEYAIDAKKIGFEHIKRVYSIIQDLDFDYFPEVSEIYNNLFCIYDFDLLKEKIQKILTGPNASETLSNNIEDLLKLIPEIENIINFDHKHPHHNLDVWQHTLAVIRNLNTDDFELNMAALLHDIGKPFSYQDGEIRHFHGHPEKSYQMTLSILTRLGYDKDFINRVSYLVKTHDTIIDSNNLDSTYDMIKKRLKLQYADAKAHHPDTVEKRINFLDRIEKQLNTSLDEFER